MIKLLNFLTILINRHKINYNIIHKKINKCFKEVKFKQFSLKISIFLINSETTKIISRRKFFFIINLIKIKKIYKITIKEKVLA